MPEVTSLFAAYPIYILLFGLGRDISISRLGLGNLDS
jgi:hypothetical protein